jgi:hypothetical protein
MIKASNDLAGILFADLSAFASDNHLTHMPCHERGYRFAWLNISRSVTPSARRLIAELTEKIKYIEMIRHVWIDKVPVKDILDFGTVVKLLPGLQYSIVIDKKADRNSSKEL